MWQPPTQQPQDHHGSRVQPTTAEWKPGLDPGGSPRLRLSAVLTTAAGKVLAGALVAALVVGFASVYLSFAAAHSPQTNSNTHLAPGSGSVLPTASATASATPTAAATSTVTSGPPEAYLRVTQNQDVRFACVSAPHNYNVSLVNTGPATVTWQISIPYTPLGQRYPYWVGVGPGGEAGPVTGGTLAPGQSSTFTMWPQGGYPCAGQTYQATIHSHTSDGQPQPDLKLAYAGSGPEAYAHLDVIQNQNYSESCANGASVPPPYTAQIKDTGTVRAFPMVLAVETNGPFSTPSLVGQIHLTPGQTWIDAGQTVIIDVIPQSWIGCKPGTYHFKIELRDVDWQGNTQDVIFTDTIT